MARSSTATSSRKGPRLSPELSRRRVVRSLIRAGFIEVRSSGGHVIWRGPNGHCWGMPNHIQFISTTLLRQSVEASGVAWAHFVDQYH